jgi:hypothetical protein
MIGTARQPVKVAAPKWNRKGEFAGEPELSARLGLPRNRSLEWIERQTGSYPRQTRFAAIVSIGDIGDKIAFALKITMTS